MTCQTQEDDSACTAFIFELSYRLTVAANISMHKLESLSWMGSWHADILACAEKWYDYLAPSTPHGQVEDFYAISMINQIIKGLSPGYSKFISAPIIATEDSPAYKYLSEQAYMIAHTPMFSESRLSEFFLLGRQLAQNDLRAYYSAIGKEDLPIYFSNCPPFVPFTETPFPRCCSCWPDDASFNDNLNRYVGNRQCYAGSRTFSIGPLMCLVRSIVCPRLFPATVWCWQDWEGVRPWRLFLAGAIFPRPTLVSLKDRNDKAFITLLEAMDKDRKAGCAMDDCGWVSRNALWPEMKRTNTRSKAWRKMTKKTLAIVGDFESKGGVGKYKGAGGPCRAPVTLAEPECRIFIEKLK